MDARGPPFSRQPTHLHGHIHRILRGCDNPAVKHTGQLSTEGKLSHVRVADAATVALDSGPRKARPLARIDYRNWRRCQHAPHFNVSPFG